MGILKLIHLFLLSFLLSSPFFFYPFSFPHLFSFILLHLSSIILSHFLTFLLLSFLLSSPFFFILSHFLNLSFNPSFLFLSFNPSPPFFFYPFLLPSFHPFILSHLSHLSSLILLSFPHLPSYIFKSALPS